MKPLLMQTLPNSGSTWLADIIAEALPSCRYAMEFFNPARNEKYEALLAKQFGAELVSCYRNIAFEGDSAIDDDITESWGKEGYTFTKEVFSPFKLRVFVRHFDCFVLLRTAEETFPPSRPRVWAFYEHAWWALAEMHALDLQATTMRSRALEAHGILSERIRLDAKRLDVPVIEYASLFDAAPAVARTFRKTGLFAPKSAAEIAASVVATRTFRQRAA